MSPAGDYERSAEYVERAAGSPLRYRPGEESVAAARADDLLRDGLTAAEAVELALLNNPRLQAALLEIGIGQAEVVQSGLLANPQFSLMLRFPDGGGLSNLDMGLAHNLAELWQLPRRRKVAEADLERIVLDVSRTASLTALESKAGYVGALQADQQRDLTRENLAITRQLLDLVIARREVGAVSEVDVNLARAQHLEVDLALRRGSLAAVAARAELCKTLGLRIAPGELVLVDPLAEPEAQSLTVEQVIAAARGNRLDYRAVGMSVQSAEARVGLERTKFLRSLELGISAEREARWSESGRDWLADTAWASAEAGGLALPSLRPDEDHSTDWLVGPTLGFEVPLFDQNQAQIAKAEYEYQRTVKALEALDRELTQEAYVAVERVRTATDSAKFYRQEFLPLQDRGLQLAREAYRSGSTTLLSVLDTQRGLLAARAGYVDTLADAALATTELERVSGLTLTTLVHEAQAQQSPAEPGTTP